MNKQKYCYRLFGKLNNQWHCHANSSCFNKVLFPQEIKSHLIGSKSSQKSSRVDFHNPFDLFEIYIQLLHIFSLSLKQKSKC
jgi:hypothetical protein